MCCVIPRSVANHTSSDAIVTHDSAPPNIRSFVPLVNQVTLTWSRAGRAEDHTVQSGLLISGYSIKFNVYTTTESYFVYNNIQAIA